ncbi:MAG: right-handed parallel beta-helix repeat-containing protein [Phycisphaeraceae bacterium]|nr:right-handed parallel beta-helix repeat-containing protein [Phycisphaeraceae bacterium]
MIHPPQRGFQSGRSPALSAMALLRNLMVAFIFLNSAPASGGDGAAESSPSPVTFQAVTEALQEGRHRQARMLAARIAADEDQPLHARAFARLRIAQTYFAQGDFEAARLEYERIAADEGFSEFHRAEAEELAAQMLRRLRGASPHDPETSRVRLDPIEAFAAEVFVAPDGDDAGDGSARRPWATLTQARDHVRQLRGQGVEGPILVSIGAGTYSLTETALSLTAEDSGRPGAPTVWRAREPGTVKLYGGRRLTGFAPVTDEDALKRIPGQAADRVVQLNLRAMGIEDLGRLHIRGFGQPTPPATVELFFNGRPMTLARWPNQGMVGVRRVIEPGSRQDNQPSVFVFESDRHARWVDAPDGWIFGYFHFLWADAAWPIGSIDPEARTLTTAEPYHYGGRGMETDRQPIRYYAFNLLEELDQPGEWYLDRRDGTLYMLPPGDLEDATVEIGLLNGPMVTMQGVSDVRLEGLVLDLGRSDGLVARDCSRIIIAGLTVRRMASTGISMRGGRDNTVLGCDVHTLGRRGIEMIGGDRRTLTPGRHTVANCWIYDFGRIDRTYTPAVQLEGVGNRVAHNRMHHGPSSAMRIEGNDHIVEFNDFHDLVLESDDQGAIDMFGNPTYRRVIFRHNRFSDIGKTDGEPSVHGQAGIRFDDTISGMIVHGNLFVRSSNHNFGAIQIHAGRDNLIEGNVFVECTHGISGGWGPGNHFWRAARRDNPPEAFHTNDLYRERYPEIATMLDSPGINFVRRNLFVDVRNMFNRARHMDSFKNLVAEDAGFVDLDAGDFRFKDDAAALTQLGLLRWRLDAVGPYADDLRASWPVRPTKLDINDPKAP